MSRLLKKNFKSKQNYTVGSAKISIHAAVVHAAILQYCNCVTSGRLTGSNTIGFTPASSGHSRVKGDKTGHWLASWLAGRPGMPLSGCWLANRSPAELSWYLCNRPATSRLTSNQPATGQPPGSNRLERPDKLYMGRQWVAISRATAKAGIYRQYCRCPG